MSTRRFTSHAPGRRHGVTRWGPFIGMAVLAAQLLSSQGAVAQGSGSDWPQYLHDASGSGFTSETLLNATNAGSLKPKAGWPITLANGAVCPSAQDYCTALIASQPTIATVSGNTLLFVGSWNGSEYAICPGTCSVGGTTYSTGQVVWATYVGRTSGCGGPSNSRINGVTGAAAVGTVTNNGVTTGAVFVGAGGDIALSGAVIPNATSRLFALNALTGAVLWQTPLGPAPTHYLWSSPVLANGSIYIGIASADDCPLVRGGVVQLNPNSGQVLHTFYTVPSACIGASVWGSAAVDASGDVYVATGNDGTCSTTEYHAEAVLKLSSTLALLAGWHLPLTARVIDGDFGNTPTVFAGTVTTGGTLRPLLGVANKNGYYYVFDTAKLGSGPVKKIRVAVGGSDPETGGGSISPSSWDGHYVYVAGGTTTVNGTTYQGSIRAYDPNNLVAPVWQLGLNGGPVLAAVASDPGVAVASAGAFISVVGSASGTTLFQGVAPGFYGAPSIAYGVLYEGDTQGGLHAYSVNGQ